MNGVQLDDHDRGLQHDLAQIAVLQTRRRMLGLMLSGGAAALLVGCGGDGGTTASSATTPASGGSTNTGGASSGSCVATAQETAGPYPSDGSNTVNGQVSNVLGESGVVRRDIRSSFGIAPSIAPGVPLELTLSLVNTNN